MEKNRSARAKAPTRGRTAIAPTRRFHPLLDAAGTKISPNKNTLLVAPGKLNLSTEAAEQIDVIAASGRVSAPAKAEICPLDRER